MGIATFIQQNKAKNILTENNKLHREQNNLLREIMDSLKIKGDCTK